ncbi:PilZ domain-containing protein [Shigella flexneri]
MRPLIVTFKSIELLNTYYLGFIKNGGFFLPKPNEIENIRPNEQILLTMKIALPDITIQEKVLGRVIWITPAGTLNEAPEGIGMAFENNKENTELKEKIENLLNGKEKLDNQLFYLK